MSYDLKAIIDGIELLEAQDVMVTDEVMDPSITNVTLVNSACAGVMEIGATASDQLTLTVVNPHKTSFDGAVIEFYTKEIETEERTRAAEIEELVGEDTTDEMIAIDRDSAEEDDEDEEEITAEEEEDAEEVDEELSSGLDAVLEGEDHESTTEDQEEGEIDEEWEQLGLFYVYSQNTNADGSITLVCYDGFCKMNGTFEPTNETATIEDMFDDLTDQVLENCGITIDEEDFDDIADEEITIDFTCSYREAMGYFAGLLGGYAEFGQDGTCGISLYMFDDNNIIDSDLISYSESSAGEMVVESIICNRSKDGITDNTIESGSGGQSISFVNPFMTKNMLDSIFAKYQGFRFSGGTTVVSWDERMSAGEFVRIFDETEYENYLMVKNYLEQEEEDLTEEEIQQLREGLNQLGRIILISSQTIDFRGDATSSITSICDSESTKVYIPRSPTNAILGRVSDDISQKLDESDMEAYYSKTELGQALAFSEEEGLIFQVPGSDYKTVITNTQIAFYFQDQPVAYMNGNALVIPKSVMLDEMQVGERKWSWRIRQNDNLQLKWIGN